MIQICNVNKEIAIIISLGAGFLFIILHILLVGFKAKREEARDDENSKMFGGRYRKIKKIVEEKFKESKIADGVKNLHIKYVFVTEMKEKNFTAYVGARGKLKKGKWDSILEYWNFKLGNDGNWQVESFRKRFTLWERILAPALFIVIVFETVIIL